MARNPAIELVCDRTGEAEIVRTGVTLDSMDKAPALPTVPALELSFHPRGGEQRSITFQDLCSRSEAMVAHLVDALASDGYFDLVPQGAGAAAEFSAPANLPASETPAPSAEKAPTPATKTSRRSMVEIEADRLTDLVEAASSKVYKLENSSEAVDELAIADAYEELRKALQLQAHFEALDDKGKKELGRASRDARKLGQPVPEPADLPKLTLDVLQKYGFSSGQDAVNEPDEAGPVGAQSEVEAAGETVVNDDVVSDDGIDFTPPPATEDAAGATEPEDFL